MLNLAKFRGHIYTNAILDATWDVYFVTNTAKFLSVEDAMDYAKRTKGVIRLAASLFFDFTTEQKLELMM